jgi:hypothetical protein
MRLISLTAVLAVTLVAADYPLDKEGVWALELRVQSMRTITVEVPGQGKKTYHYLRYEIVNNTGEARQAAPAFELVTHDKSGAYKEVMNADVFKAIVKQEDPDGTLDLKDTAAVAKKAIPPSKKDAPAAVNGVAVWEGVDPTSHHFSAFVAGLSNGRVTDDRKTVRRKTLQLNFKTDGETIRFVAPPQWLYRVDKAATEKKDADPKPQPNESEAERDAKVLRLEMANVTGSIEEVKKELRQLGAAKIKARDAYLAQMGICKTRPAGDTPELLRRDRLRATDRLESWQALCEQEIEWLTRLVALERRLDELQRRVSEPNR